MASPARRKKKVAWIVVWRRFLLLLPRLQRILGSRRQGELTVTGFVDTIENYPTTFSGGNVDETNTVTVASQDAGVLAKETPGSLKDVLTGASVRTEIASLHTFLLAGVKMAHGDASAAGPVKNFDDTFMGSVLGTVCT